MKAIRVHQFGGPEVLRLEEVPDPRPGPGQVVVKLHAVGINPVDTYIRKGIYGPKDFPYTPGTDAAGVVESVGEGVKKYKPGDRVYTAGTLGGAYAEKALCSESQVHPLPDKITFQQGAAVHVPYATAFRALHVRARAVAGEFVLIHGASGGVGVAAVQLARIAGPDRGRHGRHRSGPQARLGPGRRTTSWTTASPNHLEEGVALTGGRGFDLILEMAANENLGKDLPAPGAQRAGGGDRQPGQSGDRRPPGHEPRRKHPGHDADELRPSASSPASTPPWWRGWRRGRCGPSSGGRCRWRTPPRGTKR